MAGLLGYIKAVLDGYGQDQISVQHLCYRLASTGVIAKTELAFKLLGKHLATWREQSLIRYGRFVDGTRWHYVGTTFDDAGETLEQSISAYRRNAQPFFVDVWVEKEAVASIGSMCCQLLGDQDVRLPRLCLPNLVGGR